MVGVGLGLYATLIERQWFALRRAVVPVLSPGAKPLRVLHLSDLHMLARQQHKADWVSGLAGLHPDLVVLTGDTLAAEDAVAPSLAALGPLLDMPGAFVFGNNDFYAPEPKSPHRYFTKRTHVRRKVDLPWRELRDALTGRGWADLNNARAVVTAVGTAVALAGVNDPHTRRDRYETIEGPANAHAAVRIGVTHSPEPRLLDRFAADGYDVILAGHTHGGQVRLPGVGALVTNCGIDRSRARGLSRWGASTWLNVSAGLGNSPYMPVRFCCRPEATLLTLVARPSA
jgi:predicted MPP superfamily phosphohydrolase